MKDLPSAIQNKVSKFCNSEKLCCYLCKRKFEAVNGLSDHVKLSEFHLFNLSKWISSKRKEINNVAAKFYSSIAGSNECNAQSVVSSANVKKSSPKKKIKTAHSASLQDE